jgi:ankyrin repeat protein
MEVVMSESPSRPTTPLPPRPDFDQLKKQAKELRASGAFASLAEAQHALARRHGFASWPKLKLAVELTTLRRLIEEGEPEPVRQLLAASPRLVRQSFDDGSTPLHVAAGENRPRIIEVLVEFGPPLVAKFGRSSHSALSWAITCWAFDAAHKLVELGAKPDLFCAAGMGLLDRVQSFWPAGRRVARPSVTGSSRYDAAGQRLPSPPESAADQVSDALYLACRCDRLAVARWLLDHGADPNWRGFCGATCLAWAEFSGNRELSALLRERGGSDTLRDHEYRATPQAFGLMVLAGWGFAEQLLARLTADRTIASFAFEGRTLLHVAAQEGQRRTALLLLHFGADRAAKDLAGLTPAEVAAASGHAALAEHLR